MRVANGEWQLFATPYSLFALLLLLARDRLGRTLARARVGMGTLAAHRQSAAMTQAAIAAEVHQTLDFHAGLATQVAFDHVVAVNHFTNLQHFLIAQLRDPAINRNLDFVQDVGRILLADTMDVLERDQNALVGRNIHAGNTGHGLLSCRRSLAERLISLFRAGVRKREHDALPLGYLGARHRQNYPTGYGLIKGFNLVSSTVSKL